MVRLRDTCISDDYATNLVHGINAIVGRELALRGDLDGGVEQLRGIADDLFNCEYYWPFVQVTAFLVETLVERGAGDDLAEAEGAMARLAALPSQIDPLSREITLLRLRALVARGRGDESTYRDYRDRYLAMATSLGFEGHIAVAQQMG